MANEIEPNLNFGWVDHPDRHLVAAEFPGFAQAAPRCMAQAASDEPVLLYKAWKDVLGKYPSYIAQVNGTCVSMGHGHGNDLLQCVEISMGEPSEYRETDTEFIYATSREVAGILGRRDGSYGSAAVKAMTTIGVVSREMLGADGVYSGSRERDWGYRGAPQKYKDMAAPYKLGSAALVSTWDELEAAIRNGYPVTICSNQGFTMTRDSQGFCAARGWWAHCMVIGAVRFDRPGACILQSWGPETPSGPVDLEQPHFSFWADRKVVENILAQGDSWALNRSPDFVEKKLPPHWNWSTAA
jgi:hypothetical protein